MIKFGTGGWRAIIGEDFTKRNVQILSLAIVKMMKENNETENGLCIGYDRRFLSREASEWVCEVFAKEEIAIKILNRDVPTPLVMFAVQELNMSYGMCTTASHNPAVYNGVKVFTKGGRDADEIATAEIEKYIDIVEKEYKDKEIGIVPFEIGVKEGKIEIFDYFNEYIDSIIDALDIASIKKSRLKVALDPMYGVSQTSLSTVLFTARCEVDVIHARHDALFGGRLPAPNDDTMKPLINFVLEKGCDLGIATDGDADRLGVIDDTGEFLSPNKILVLLYYYLLKYKGWKGDSVRNNSTTHMMDIVAKAYGSTCHEVPVGFKHISSNMAKYDAIIGGESSGGLTVKGHIAGKDGVYAAGLLVEMVAVSGKKLSQLWADIETEFGKLHERSVDFKMTQEKKDALKAKLFEEKAIPTFHLPVKTISYMDGCKVYFENGGWVIARFSGTEPLLRIAGEMPDADDFKAIDVFKEFLGL